MFVHYCTLCLIILIKLIFRIYSNKFLILNGINIFTSTVDLDQYSIISMGTFQQAILLTQYNTVSLNMLSYYDIT